MSIPREEPKEAGVLMLFDADSKADLNSLFSWLDDGLVKGELERLAEGRFVVLLSPAVHDVVWRPS